MMEIGPVVIEIQGVENGELAVSVNNTLVCHTAFLPTDTRLCVLIRTCSYISSVTKYYYNFKPSSCKTNALHCLYVSTVPVHHTCSRAIKHKLMGYITCVLLLFTGNHAHAKIAYNSACTYQIKFYMW